MRWQVANLDRSARWMPWLSLTLLFAICVLFLFPSQTGPFQAVRGPTTAFRAEQKARIIKLAMAAVLVRRNGRIAPVSRRDWPLIEDLSCEVAAPCALFELNCVLLV